MILNTSKQQGIVCKSTLATDRFEDIPEADLLLVCVKSYDLEPAIQEIAKKAAYNTVIVPLLNGVDICDRIRSVLTVGIVLPACVFVGTHIESPGVVTQKGGDGKIMLGPDPQNPDFDTSHVRKFLGLASVNYQWMDDPLPAIWEKYVFISAFGLVTAKYNKTLDEVMADKNLKSKVRAIMNEVLEIASCEGVSLPEDIIERSLEKANGFSFEAKTSYQRDVEKGGKNEGEIFGGTIIRLGEKYSVATPVTRDTYSKSE